MPQAPFASPSPAQLPRRGVERLDLLLLSVEALDLNGGEAMVWMSEQMGFSDRFPNRVALWKSRCHNPLRRTTRRGNLPAAESDALIRILCALADRLYPVLRGLLSKAEAPELLAQRWILFHGRLADLVKERMNPRRGGVQKLLNPETCVVESHRLVQALALGSGAGGFERLKASLLDAAA
ncbi:MAG: DUF3038 domain-containing protein [Synechococcaceae bacterium WB9_2_170]|nr:DUF3038 domain-containing protein [Synechococcaceae bacterium WB9_2_170]